MKRTVTALLVLLSGAALGQVTQGPALTGTTVVVNNSSGDQTDPHVSGDWVAYTNEVSGNSEIRYHNLADSTDNAVPSNGGLDFLSDVGGNTLVYTHLAGDSSIWAFDLQTQATPVELDPQAGSNRREARVGGNTVAWQDFGYTGDTSTPEVAAYDLSSGTVTRLTNDLLLDKDPAVSPDGNAVVWTKCQTDGTACDIWEATNLAGVWTEKALTGAEGQDALPDTNGQVVVYSSVRTTNGVSDEDIYWQPVGGGPEQHLALPGQQTNPNISGTLIAFEQLDTSTPVPNFDIWLFDIATQTLYRLTNSPEDETLNDISVLPDGTARVVWTKAELDDNVYAFSFTVPAPPPPPPPPPTCTSDAGDGTCANTGNRPLLAELDLVRQHGKPFFQVQDFDSDPGQGLLCVDNGVGGSPATAGAVFLNNEQKIDASVFTHKMSHVEQAVNLSSHDVAAAIIMGEPGSAYRVRIYGPPPSCDGQVTDGGTPPPSDDGDGDDDGQEHHDRHHGHHRSGQHDGDHHDGDHHDGGHDQHIAGTHLSLVNGSYVVQAQAAPEVQAMGCSGAGMSGLAVAILGLLGLLWSGRRAVPVPVKARKK